MVGGSGLSPEAAPDHFGLFALLASMDITASSALTRKQLSWEPTHPALLADLEEGHYPDGR
jgi:hypothetical protein